MDGPTPMMRKSLNRPDELTRVKDGRDAQRFRDESPSPSPSVRSPSPKAGMLESTTGKKSGRDRVLLSPVEHDIPIVMSEIRQPRRNLLNPNVGNVEIWPGGFEDKTSFQRMDDLNTSGAPQIRRGQKPRLLLDLESYVEQELKLLNCPPQGPSEARVQVFRSCFDIFIETFTTYKPLLTRIKLEYDILLDFLEQRVNQLIPTEIQLLTIREEHEKKLKFYQRENSSLKKQLEDEREKCHSLENLAASLRSDLDECRQKIAYLEKEYEESSEVIRDLEQKFRTMQSTLNETELELRDVQTRHDEKMIELERLRLLLQDMVPKEHLDNSIRDLIKTRTDLFQKTIEEEQIRTEIGNLKKTLQAALEQYQSMLSTHTPRPDLTAAMQLMHVEDAPKSTIDTFQDIFNYASSIMNELTVMKDKYPDIEKPTQKPKEIRPKGVDMISALGAGPEVPKYLRFKGKVRNRHIPKYQLEAFIKELMAARSTAPPEDAVLPFEEYLFVFLQKKFGIQSMIAEWGYSLLDSLKRFDYDADCELLLKILQGETGEEVYFEQQRMLDKLHKTFMKVDTELNSGKVTGTLGKPDIRPVIKKFFISKVDEDLAAVLKALEEDAPGPTVEYDKLFLENREGDQGAFLEEIRDQYLKERTSYLKDIEDALRENATDGIVTVAGARTAFTATDPKKPKAELNELLCRSFKIKEITPESDNVSLSIEEVMKNIRFGVLKRQSKKDANKKRARQGPNARPAAGNTDSANPSLDTTAQGGGEAGVASGDEGAH